MTLGELFGPAAGWHGEIEVTDLVSDSRQVTAGAAFIALPGERSHGLEYAARALEAGARIVIYDAADKRGQVPEPNLAVPGLNSRVGALGRRFYTQDASVRELIGITGTDGKTTVAFLVAQALTALGRPCGYIGTLGFGSPDALREHALTTPDCLALHREIAAIDAEAAAIEVSSHALEQDRVAGLDFGIAALTNFSRDHLDWHGSLEKYFAAKAKLFERPGLRAAVINVADAGAARMQQRVAPTVAVIGVALGTHADARLEARVDVRGLDGLVLRLEGAYGRATLESRLIGTFNAENLLVAAGVLAAAGYSIDAIADALGGAVAAPGRMEVFGGGSGPWVVVDYAHTPRALERVLAELAAASAGAVTCVFGCGGDRDRGKRELMGRAAAAHAAHIVLTDDNPRSEDPARIVAEIAAGTAGHADVQVVHDRAKAIRGAIAWAKPGDVVLVAGKGHETVQIVGDERRDFDDRAIVRMALGSVS
ncbi:MAG: UDP-N-acetylmuramoyl-L-alanyl-D-glutamate--2,6-diaminopimelate ligase [Gammaproteobacteria bacterium]|nr:UDP-N-acetylmuramoyl-L-alanyl-D-glutamate--2,6-diaminopimelate ligase [Gammaproteobacteria bacterium]